MYPLVNNVSRLAGVINIKTIQHMVYLPEGDIMASLLLVVTHMQKLSY